MRQISPSTARRIAVRAQGLTAPRPARYTAAVLSRTIGRMGVLQIDSVNAFERSHYLPLLSRLGPYPRPLLDDLLRHDRPGGLGGYTEYLAHEATVLPVTDWPLWGWYREAWRTGRRRGWADANRRLLGEVRSEFAARGPLRVPELEHPGNVRLKGGWWNRNEVHWAADHLFRSGELVVLGRDRFQRRFALADTVLPESARVELPREEAILELVRRAALAYGVATVDDLADYPRLRPAVAAAAVERLVGSGELEPVQVDGWGRSAYLAAGTRVPRGVEAAALLSPFDPLVWYRPRAERLFGFHYRISIYTPKEQRQHGYYVLPVLVDDRLVGRVDLKSDRQAGVLRVQHAHIEPDHSGERGALALRVAPLLHEAAAWQGLSEVAVTGPGTWAADLARRV